jgi:hypothetical protein
MAALWSEAMDKERCDMVMLVLGRGGLHYEVEVKEIAAITPVLACADYVRRVTCDEIADAVG